MSIVFGWIIYAIIATLCYQHINSLTSKAASPEVASLPVKIGIWLICPVVLGVYWFMLAVISILKVTTFKDSK